MVIVRLTDNTEYIWAKKEKPPPRKLTFYERNPNYNPNVNYKDKHLGLLHENKYYCPLWALTFVKGFGSYAEYMSQMYYGTEAVLKRNETAYMYYEDDSRGIKKRSVKSASQEAFETFGLVEPKKKKVYSDKWFVTYNWKPDHFEGKDARKHIAQAETGVARLFMKEYVLEARGCFEFHGTKKNHPHFMCVLKVDTEHNAIETSGKLKKVLKEASIAKHMADNFVEILVFEEYHDDYVDLIKCDAKQDALDKDRIWRRDKDLKESYNKTDYMKDC